MLKGAAIRQTIVNMMIPTDNLSHNKDDKMFAAEASDISLKDIHEQVTLVSQRTGRSATFEFHETMYDQWEEEVQGWIYVPTSQTIARHPGLAGYKLHIFND